MASQISFQLPFQNSLRRSFTKALTKILQKISLLKLLPKVLYSRPFSSHFILFHYTTDGNETKFINQLKIRS